MKNYFLIVCFVVVCSVKCFSQTDWTHPKVKQLNLTNNYITKDGQVVYRATNNSSLTRATYYEYFNATLFATTSYILVEKERPIYIVFRGDPKTNDFTQIVETKSNPSPSYSGATLSVNQKLEITNNGVVSGVYRTHNFIDLLYLKTVRGALLMKN